MKFILLILSIGILTVACSKVNEFFGLKDDNVVEELVEEGIKQKTGLDVDLTPGSPEHQ